VRWHLGGIANKQQFAGKEKTMGQAKNRPNRIQEAIARQEAQDQLEAKKRNEEAEREHRRQISLAAEWAKLTPEQQQERIRKAAYEAETMSYLASIFDVTKYGRFFQ
jgi:hypothetical protein